MADGDAEPGDEAAHARGVEQPEVDGLVVKEGRQEAQARDRRRGEERVARDAGGGELAEDLRGRTLVREHEEHARGGVEAGVARREHRGEDHGVHECGGREQARVLEDEREGAYGDVGHVVPEKARVGVRNDQADDEDREDVEEQDSPEDLSDGLGNVLLGMLGFASGDADELGSLEGECNEKCS